jgi:hypothetical protein
VPDLLDQLRDQRTAARTAADEILTRAQVEQRDLAADELATYQAQVEAERAANDALEREHAKQLTEVRALATRSARPTLSREAAETARAFRSAIFAQEPGAHRGLRVRAGRRVARRRA